MREYRTGYIAAPCGADRLRKPSYVTTRVDITVRPVATRTGEAMLHPFSNFPAHRARLARVGGVDIDNSETGPLRLVGHKVLQLPKGPTVQSRSDALTGLNTLPNMRQVFHANLAGSRGQSLGNNGFTDLVVNVFHMPLLTPGDSFEFALGGAATVGLETTAMGKVNITLVSQLVATPDLASAGRGEIVFPDINPQNATARDGGNFREIEDEIEIPDSLTDNESRFRGRTTSKQVALMSASGKNDLDTTRQGEQRQGARPNRVSALIKIDRNRTKSQSRNRPVFRNTFVGLKRFVGVGHPVNRLTDHLTTERRELFSNLVIGQMVQCDTVPTTMFLHQRDYSRAGLSKRSRQISQGRRLLWCRQKLQRYGTLGHIGYISHLDTKDKPSPYLPGLKAGVSRRH